MEAKDTKQEPKPFWKDPQWWSEVKDGGVEALNDAATEVRDVAINSANGIASVVKRLAGAEKTLSIIEEIVTEKNKSDGEKVHAITVILETRKS